MIVREYYTQREDGVPLYITRSDLGFKIRQVETGAVYDEAVDVEDAEYTYEETEELIEEDIE